MKGKNIISSLKHDNGLTLIEVVISMAIFAVGFLAIAGLVVATAKNNTTGNMLTQATMLARTKIEYLKTLPLDQLAIACPEQGLPETVNGVYVRECRISSIESSTTQTIKTVRITVRWRKMGQLRKVVLQTNTRGRGK